MHIPGELLLSLENVAGFERESFLKTHTEQAPPVSIRLNPAKITSVNALTFSELIEAPVPWSEYGYYLTERPSFIFDPLWHGGCYYVQEASSMFLEQVIRQLADLEKSLTVLDLSAAPGGKSTHLQSLLSTNSLLVSNEVIRSRTRILEENLSRWGGSNVVITQNDPRDFGILENFFDVIVVDAPCSGSGLFRRDAKAIEEWSQNNVQHCAGRQRRILSDILPALKPGGILIYSTCSYSPEEDEEIGAWMEAAHGLAERTLDLPAEWRITRSQVGYRFWPDKVRGEGFFIAAFSKSKTGEAQAKIKQDRKTDKLKNEERSLISTWIDTSQTDLVMREKFVYSWPLELSARMNLLFNRLKVQCAGILVGELVKNKLVPAHSLALSGKLPDKIPRVELGISAAIDYLSRKEIHIEGIERGWHVVCFNGHELGWINSLGNRINNYYPKEFRILKQRS